MFADSSGVNRTGLPRRALSVTLADAEQTDINPEFQHQYGDGRETTVLFGSASVPSRLGHDAETRRYRRHFDGVAPVEHWALAEGLNERERLREIGLDHLSKL